MPLKKDKAKGDIITDDRIQTEVPELIPYGNVSITEIPKELFVERIQKKGEASGLFECTFYLSVEKNLPIERCDGTIIGDVLPDLGDSLQDFIAEAQLRPVGDIVKQLQQHYQIHMSQKEAFKNDGELHFGLLITYERIHALNWVTGLIDQWDD